MKTETKKQKTEKEEKLAEAGCKDKDCPTHGNLKTRGRIFEGIVKRKLPRRIMIEFERMIYVKKYERYYKSLTRIHARLPHCMEKEIQVGDLVKVMECRPLSKIVHAVVIKKTKSSEGGIK